MARMLVIEAGRLRRPTLRKVAMVVARRASMHATGIEAKPARSHRGPCCTTKDLKATIGVARA